jgi:hypothetical protein
MPSRATYYIVPKNERHTRGRAMNPVGEDGENVKLAAQLSRIMCRKLEVDAYNQLQKAINTGFIADPEVVFLKKLGQILITLRWRLSWWMMLGGGGSAGDAGMEKFEYRVQQLSRVLYFYYCALKRKLPSFTDLSGLRGVSSQYADTTTKVWDEFPRVETIEGFHAWMAYGKVLIEKAGVKGKISRIKEASPPS